jgi:nucleotide-binding universal stress UspA family protein
MKFDPTSAVRRVQPPRTVLIPLDSSDLSRRALPFASGLAKRGGGRLVLSHATWLPPAAKDWRDPLEVVLHEVEVAATADLEALAAPLRAEGVDVEVRVCGQAPDVGIPQARRAGCSVA